jgi:CheY-like chemotaxis protein
VLLDVSMPEFSGMDVLESLGREELIGKQKIVLFTASDIPDQEKKDLLAKGVTAFLKKPIELNTLLQKLDELNKMTCKDTVNL